MRGEIVFLDTNVLYGALKRDMLLTLALTCDVDLKWSAYVLQELSHHLTAYFVERGAPDAVARVNALTKQMNTAYPRALLATSETVDIGTGWPDQDDEKIVVDALRAGAGLIVTDNLRDFPRALLEPLGLAASSADEFLGHLTLRHRGKVERRLAAWLMQRTRPKYSRSQLVARLREIGMPAFSDALTQLL